VHFASERVRVRSLGSEGLADHSTAGLRSAMRRVAWLPRVARAPLSRGYAVMSAGLAHGSRLVAQARAPRTEYDCLIGVDADGLALAAAMAGGATLGYYSLELLLSEELTTPAERRLKEQERMLSQRAAFVIVQDAERAALLIADNSLDSTRVILVPNAPMGPARRRRLRLWHERFGLAAQQRVVLHAGSLGDWTGIDDLVASVSTWPEPWVLVVHTRYDGETSSYTEALRARADGSRVFFSLKPVEHRAYDDLVDSADAGLAFYVPNGASAYTQRNVQTIGLSSGKLAYYLRAGLPVIVNRGASIGATIEEAGCGLAVQDAAHVGPALAGLAAGYDQYSQAALRFFDEHLDFRRAFDKVTERIEAAAVRV
jgi:glycosyltransferase involved in cell wall biosynthesis